MPVADSVVIEGCQSYTALQNNIVRSGHYQGSFFDYKHFWCLDEELEIVWNPIFERYQKTAYYGAIVNVDLEQLILDLLDGLFIPAFDQFIKPYLNNGNPACEPYCPEGDGINPFSGNYYFSDTIISVDMPYMKLTYNSSVERWVSSIDQEIIDYAEGELGEDAPEAKGLLGEDGRIRPMLASHDTYVCSPGELHGWIDGLTDEFTAELLNRVMTFFPDGRVKEIMIRSINRSINFEYDDINNRVVVSSFDGEEGFSAQMDESGRPTSVQSLGDSDPVTASFEWGENGNLLSRTRNGSTISFLYEDSSRPGLLTGIVNEKGNRQSTYEYDSQKRIVRSAKFDHAGQEVKVVSIDYSYATGEEPFVRVTDENGLVSDKYYQEYFGVYRTTRVVQRPTGQDPIVLVQRSHNRLGHLTEEIDAEGVVTRYERDGFGRETRKVEALGTGLEKEVLTTWDKKCNRPSVVIRDGRRTTTVFDAQCRVASQTVASL